MSSALFSPVGFWGGPGIADIVATPCVKPAGRPTSQELDGLDPASYLIFDCPGQVELYIHNESMKAAVTLMTEEWNIRVSHRESHRESG